MCVWPAQSDCKCQYLFFYQVKCNTFHYSGPAKYISPTVPPQPSHMTWHPAATMLSTYPSSYILTDAPPPLPSANVYRPSILCPPDRSWRVPDPHDCSIYHDCYHGKDLVSYCPAQLQYNREKQTCDHAVNVQCENKCTNENDQAKFVDLTSCCHYYQCSNGRLIRQACSHPHSFDIQTRTCLPYKRVKCDGRRQCLSKCKSLITSIGLNYFIDKYFEVIIYRIMKLVKVSVNLFHRVLDTVMDFILIERNLIVNHIFIVQIID